MYGSQPLNVLFWLYAFHGIFVFVSPSARALNVCESSVGVLNVRACWCASNCVPLDVHFKRSSSGVALRLCETSHVLVSF